MAINMGLGRIGSLPSRKIRFTIQGYDENDQVVCPEHFIILDCRPGHTGSGQFDYSVSYTFYEDPCEGVRDMEKCKEGATKSKRLILMSSGGCGDVWEIWTFRNASVLCIDQDGGVLTFQVKYEEVEWENKFPTFELPNPG